MKRSLLLLAVTLALVACGRDDRAQTVEQRQLAEAAADAQKAKPFPDASLAAIVRSALVSDTSLDANKIDVENRSGNVALYGSVESPEQRERAERIAMSVGGVRSVANHLEVSGESAGRGGR